jgi:hypothetical protein
MSSHASGGQGLRPYDPEMASGDQGCPPWTGALRDAGPAPSGFPPRTEGWSGKACTTARTGPIAAAVAEYEDGETRRRSSPGMPTSSNASFRRSSTGLKAWRRFSPGSTVATPR